MSRFVFGPTFENIVMDGGSDVGVTLAAVRASKGTVSFDLVVPVYDLATSARLLKIYGVAAPAKPATDVKPEDFLVAPGNYAAGVEVPADNTQAQALTIDVPGVPPGGHFGQTILEFAE